MIFPSFYDKNNKAAGTRVRTGLQQLKNLSQEIRLHVQDMKNTADAGVASSSSSSKSGASSSKGSSAKSDGSKSGGASKTAAKKK